MNLSQLPTVSVTMILHNIQVAAGPLTGVIFLLILTAFADTVTGLFAAWKSGTLDLKYVDTFITSHVQNKWAPILGTLIGGIAVGGVDNLLGAGLIAAAAGQIVAYEAEVFGSSITGNLRDAANKTKSLPGFTSLLAATTIDQTTVESQGLPQSNDPVVPETMSAPLDTSAGSVPIGTDKPFGEHPPVAPTGD